LLRVESVVTGKSPLLTELSQTNLITRNPLTRNLPLLFSLT
jgi:hypothetical protein